MLINIILNHNRLNIKSKFLLYGPLQLLWNHNGAVYRLGFVYTCFNKIIKFCIPFHKFFILCYPGLNVFLLCIKFLLFNAWRNASHSFPCNTMSQYFISWFCSTLKKLAELYRSSIAHLWCFSCTVSERVITLSSSGNSLLDKKFTKDYCT